MIKQLQNKKLRPLFWALLLGLSGMTSLFAQNLTEGAVSGHAFTVNPNGQTVYFSQGNLQYQASTNTWRFAEHQWDYVGAQNPSYGDPGGTVKGSDNGNISSTYAGWIDLFGWATSGYNHGAVCYQPWSTSEDNYNDYMAYGNEQYNLYDQSGQADWGYNPISNGGNQENQWRTLTNDEWNYIINNRITVSGIRYAKANVNNVNGLILLPDDWNSSYYSLNNTNTDIYSNTYDGNTLTAAQWDDIELHGAVFMPAAGVRSGNSIQNGHPYYWSATCNGITNALTTYSPEGGGGRSGGLSVRLVCSAQNYSFGINATPKPLNGGTASGLGIYQAGDECTLTATPLAGYTFISWMENGEVVSTDATYSFIVWHKQNLVANFAREDNIIFADDNVKDICVAPATGWDTNNDSELSYAEAAVITSIGTVFKGNTDIQSFNELQHFISLNTIDEQAFRNCSNLTEITIPENVASIGSRAFWNCPALATIHFNAINCTSMYNVINEENYSVFMSSLTSHPLTNLTIGNNVQHIPDYAFRGCDQIQSLDIPASVTTVGEYAFYECTGLETLTIGGGTIGEHAFHSCSGLESLTVGEGSTTIVDDYAFYDCTELETLTIGEGVTSIGEYAFWKCPALTTVHFNATNCIKMSSTLYDFSVFNSGTTYDSTPIVTLTIGNNVTCIPSGAFRNSPNVTGNLTIPNSVTSIGKKAFFECSGFTGPLTIPNSVTSIGEGAFAGCSGFTGDLIIPNSVTSIGMEAFAYCSGFTGPLTIPNSLTSIEKYAFYGCSSFTGSLIIPNSVTKIGEYAFGNCSGFDGTLIIGCNVVEIWQYAFDDCNFTALIVESSNVPFVNGEDENWRIIFNHYDIPVYVPGGKISEYQNEIGWRFFTNYKSQVNFEQDSNDQWSDDENWSSWEVPDAEDVVCITDNCQLDVDANVLYVYVADDAKVLTVNSGKTLNTTYGVHIDNASQLMVEDGAQVKSDIPFSGTVQKHIDAYTSDDDGWNFIASPVTEDQSISGLFPTGGTIYDLYYLDEENTYWRNYKVNAFDINHNQGYLYANQAGTDINFSGTMQPYVADGVSIPLTKEGEGWNLVGNPFTFNAYANKPYYVINGRNIEAAASGAIAPCTGIVVKANGTENETVKFTKDAPAGSSAQNHGSLKIALTETSTRSVSQIDNAIVSFNESETLPKFRFGDNAQIYLLQNNEDYAVANAETAGEMPVNFKATRNGEYTLTVNPENVEMEYLHLIDNLTGNDVDLLATPSYTFSAMADDYASRFRLVFSANNNNLNNDDNFAFISNGQLVVNSEGTLQVFDALGRQLYVKELSTANYQLPIVTSPGVYVLCLINGENVKTQKIVIK